MGGEKQQAMIDELKELGSPPHGRGKGGSRRIVCAQIGITPAQAGKSTGEVICIGYAKDHPRVGGEKAAYLAGLTSGVGSPPRGRGKGTGTGRYYVAQGITPAWAGKRHVNVHGVHGGLGSPPRGRGKVSTCC